MSAYLISVLNVRDRDQYSAYVAGAMETLERFGAEVLSADPAPVALEGVAPASLIVIIRFKDSDTAKAWYQSQPYSEIKRLRHESSDTKFITLTEGLV